MQKRILIVDDDKEMSERRARLLRQVGHQVILAFDGKEGLEVLNKEPAFDLLVLDLDMPKMRGDELLERIKDGPKFSSLKALVVTGMPEPGSSQEMPKRYSYGRHPITRVKELGPTQRGWDEKFALVKKWETVRWEFYLQEYLKGMAGKGDIKHFVYPDELTNQDFLDAVTEMLLEPAPVDRPREKNEPWHILVVEDDEATRKIIKKRLDKYVAYDVIQAPDGERALEILSKDPVDLVILDLEMPGVKGDEVLSVLSSNFVLNDIPVIVYTGVADWDKPEDESLRRRVEKLGKADATYEKKMRGFIGRVFKLDTSSKLLPAIERLLNERRRMGYGYLKEPITFFRNKENRWMPGALEYYQPVDPTHSRYKDMGTFLCSYCRKERKVDEGFSGAYEYNPDRLLPSKMFAAKGEPALICPECSDLLKRSRPSLGRYALRYMDLEKERSRQRQRLERPEESSMNKMLYEDVRSVLLEICTNLKPDDIEPSSDLKEVLFKDLPWVQDKSSVYDMCMRNIVARIRQRYGLVIPLRETKWFRRVRDIVDYLDEIKASPSLTERGEPRPLNEELFEKVKALLSKQLNLKVDEIKPDSKFVDDLGVDSLDTVELVMVLEEEFKIEIPDDDAEKMFTVKEMVEYLEARIEGK